MYVGVEITNDLEIHQDLEAFKKEMMQVCTIFISSVGSAFSCVALKSRQHRRKKMIQKICGTYPFIMPRFTIKVNAIEGHLQADLHLRHITKSNFSHYIRVRTLK